MIARPKPAVDELAALRVEVDGLRADVREILATLRALQAVKSPRKVPAKATVALLRVIANRSGGLNFTTAELMEHAGLVEAGEMREAILATAGELNPRKLGRFLASIQGREFAGYRLVRLPLKDQQKAAAWSVDRLESF